MSTLLLLKLVLVPVLIGALGVGERRWGPAVSGWLIGLPLTSAPIVLFLALEQGQEFASRASQGTLLGLASQAGFCLTYSWLSFRSKWLSSMLSSCFVFFAFTLALDSVSTLLVPSFIGVAGFLTLTLRLMPKVVHRKPSLIASSWQIPFRIVAATVLVLLVTEVAPWLGPRLSGLLTPFPVYATVLAVSTHRLQGPNSTVQLLRGVVIGSFTPAIFFLIVAAIMEYSGIFLAFGLASLSSLLIHGFSFKLLIRQTRPSAEPPA